MSIIRLSCLSLAVVLLACLPAPGQVQPPPGTFFSAPGSLETRRGGPYTETRQSSDVVATSWDEASRLLESSGSPSQRPARPGFWGGLLDLARGRVMIEGGYAYVTDSAAGTTISEHVVPDLLMRVGVTERLEVRIGWPGVSIVNQDGALGSSSETTALDPNVGVMLDVRPHEGWLPQTAILGSVPVTLSGNPFAMNGLQPLSAVLYQWHLTDRLSVGGDSGLAFFRESGDHYLQWQQSLDADYLLTDRVGIFTQWQVLADGGSVNDLTRHMLSGGASWLCTNRLQITWRAGVGLNNSAPNLLTDLRFGILF